MPSTVSYGMHDYVYLLEDKLTYIAKCATAGYTKALAPTVITFTSGAEGATFAQEKENDIAKTETYHTQEGSRVGLRKAILANVTRETIIKMVDPRF